MIERYTELMDAAQEQQEATNRAAIERVQLRLYETDPDFDGKHCIDGGEVIPPARLALGKIRCIRCQEIFEKTNRRTK